MEDFYWPVGYPDPKPQKPLYIKSQPTQPRGATGSH